MNASRLQDAGTTGTFDAEYRQELLCEEWNLRRKQAIREARFNCRLCGSFEPLEVHHRRYGTDKAEDLIALCRFCHQLFENHKHEKRQVYGRGEWDISHSATKVA